MDWNHPPGCTPLSIAHARNTCDVLDLALEVGRSTLAPIRFGKLAQQSTWTLKIPREVGYRPKHIGVIFCLGSLRVRGTGTR